MNEILRFFPKLIVTAYIQAFRATSLHITINILTVLFAPTHHSQCSVYSIKIALHIYIYIYLHTHINIYACSPVGEGFSLIPKF